MEAIEGAVAEDTRKHIAVFGSIQDMRNKGVPLVPFETVGRVDPDMLNLQNERAWIKGTSIRQQRDVLLPMNSSAWISARISPGTGEPSS